MSSKTTDIEGLREKVLSALQEIIHGPYRDTIDNLECALADAAIKAVLKETNLMTDWQPLPPPQEGEE